MTSTDHTETPPPPPPWGMIVKRSVLYGTAVGLIAGLVERAIRGDIGGEVAAIVRWRQFLIAGAVIGGVCGAAMAVLTRRIWRQRYGEAMD